MQHLHDCKDAGGREMHGAISEGCKGAVAYRMYERYVAAHEYPSAIANEHSCSGIVRRGYMLTLDIKRRKHNLGHYNAY
jgi:hypothetical protein